MANPTNTPSLVPAQPSPGYPYANPIYLVDYYGNPYSVANPQPVSPIGVTPTSPTDGAKASYAVSTTGLVSAASATDIFTITGSATKTIRILRVEVNGQQTTAASALVVLLKRSTANTSGTSTAPTIVPYDNLSAAASATAKAYTANPTLGTLVGAIRQALVFLSAPATTASTEKFVMDFGSRPTQAIVLRGVTDVFAINLAAVTITGGTFNINVEFTEE